MVAGATAGFRLAERTAKLLAPPSIVKDSPVFVHDKPGIADRMDRGQFVRILGITPVQGDHRLTVVNVLHQIVDIFHIIAFVTQEGTLPERQDDVGGGEDLLHKGGIRRIGGGRQLIERQTGNTVHQHMVLVAPIKLIIVLIVLIGRGMNPQSAVRIGFGVVLKKQGRISCQRVGDREDTVQGDIWKSPEHGRRKTSRGSHPGCATQPLWNGRRCSGCRWESDLRHIQTRRTTQRLANIERLYNQQRYHSRSGIHS